MERVSRLVPQLEECLVVEREAVRMTRDKTKKEEQEEKRKINTNTGGRALRHGSSSHSERGSEGILTVLQTVQSVERHVSERSARAQPDCLPYNRNHRYNFRAKGGSTWHGYDNGVHTSEEMQSLCLGMKSPSFFEVCYIGMATRRRSASSPLIGTSQARMITIIRGGQQKRRAGTLT